jgi:1,4-dihydroxy-2-naphthoyl-CoA hydrolase
VSTPSQSAQEITAAWIGLLPALLGVELLETAPERVSARMLVRPDLCTLGGVLHGGAAMAFADTLGAIATLLNLPADARTTTIESKTNFLAAAASGTRITGDCTPVHRGRTTMVWQTRISAESGKLVALVTQTQLVLPPPAK